MTDRATRGSRRVAARLLLAAACAAAGGCITFTDTVGVDLADADVATIAPGTSSRREVLERLGPPTGVFRTRLFDALVRDESFAPTAPGRVDDDVLVWQQVTIDGVLVLFPVLFTWADTTVRSRTLMVVFDEGDVVTDVSFREDVE